MKDDGWTISNEQGVSFRGNGVVLDGGKGATTISYYEGIPRGIMDWKVGGRCAWLGGNGHGRLNIQVITKLHTYIYILDGWSSEYYLLRDSVKVISVKGYNETVNQVFEMHLEKNGSNVNIYINGRLLETYTEKNPSPVTGVALSSPGKSTVLYTWAGAFIPESSTDGPIGSDIDPTGSDIDPTGTDIGPTGTDSEPTGTDSEPTSPTDVEYFTDWMEYEPLDDSYVDFEYSDTLWIQDNPADTQDPSEMDPDEQISDPPLPDNSNQDQNPGQGPSQYNPVTIVVGICLFTLNTDVSEEDAGADAETGYYLFNGVGQTPYVNIASQAEQVYCQQEQDLFDSGLIDPTTHDADYLPYGGDTPDYFVAINTHVSGDFSSVAAAQSAVAIIKYEVADADGHVIYQGKITALSSDGHTLDYYHCQAAQAINNYLEGVIK